MGSVEGCRANVSMMRSPVVVNSVLRTHISADPAETSAGTAHVPLCTPEAGQTQTGETRPYTMGLSHPMLRLQQNPRLSWYLSLSLFVYLGLGLTDVFMRAPWCDEAWFGNPAYNLAYKGFMGTTVLEPSGSYVEERQTDRHRPPHLLGDAAASARERRRVSAYSDSASFRCGCSRCSGA